MLRVAFGVASISIWIAISRAPKPTQRLSTSLLTRWATVAPARLPMTMPGASFQNTGQITPPRA